MAVVKHEQIQRIAILKLEESVLGKCDLHFSLLLLHFTDQTISFRGIIGRIIDTEAGSNSIIVP